MEEPYIRINSGSFRCLHETNALADSDSTRHSSCRSREESGTISFMYVALHFLLRGRAAWPISFPEPTCLLVSKRHVGSGNEIAAWQDAWQTCPTPFEPFDVSVVVSSNQNAL